MPSKELEKRSIPIELGGKKMHLRYDLNSMAYLRFYYEDVDLVLNKEHTEWSVDDAIHLLRAGLMDNFFDENEMAITKRDFDSVKPSIAGIGRMIDLQGLEEIILSIMRALIEAYPDVPVGTEEAF